MLRLWPKKKVPPAETFIIGGMNIVLSRNDTKIMKHIHITIPGKGNEGYFLFNRMHNKIIYDQRYRHTRYHFEEHPFPGNRNANPRTLVFTPSDKKEADKMFNDLRQELLVPLANEMPTAEALRDMMTQITLRKQENDEQHSTKVAHGRVEPVMRDVAAWMQEKHMSSFTDEEQEELLNYLIAQEHKRSRG